MSYNLENSKLKNLFKMFKLSFFSKKIAFGLILLINSLFRFKQNSRCGLSKNLVP